MARPKSKGKPGAAAPSRKATPTASKRVTAKGTGRYTPPVPKSQKVSPLWVPVVMFSTLISGMLMIILNYVDILPGGTSNGYLLGGLGLITVGFLTATKLH